MPLLSYSVHLFRTAIICPLLFSSASSPPLPSLSLSSSSSGFSRQQFVALLSCFLVHDASFFHLFLSTFGQRCAIECMCVCVYAFVRSHAFVLVRKLVSARAHSLGNLSKKNCLKMLTNILRMYALVRI